MRNINRITVVSHKNIRAKRGNEKQVKWPDFFLDNLSLDFSRNKYQTLPEDSKKDIKQSVPWYQLGTQAPIEGRYQRRTLKRTGITIDLDNADDTVPDLIAHTLGHYEYIVHESISSTQRQRRYRLIIPLANEIGLEMFSALSTLICHQLGVVFCDLKSSTSPHQLMFMPVQFSGDDLLIHHNAGSLLDGEYYLLNLWSEQFDASQDWRDYPRYQRNRDRQPVLDQREASVSGMQADPRSKTGPIGEFCNAYGIHEALSVFLPDVWTPGTEEGRYTLTGGEGRNGGEVLPYKPDGTDDTFFLSHHATDPYTGRMLNAFDLVRLHRFGGLDEGSRATKDESMPSFKAMMELCVSDPKVASEQARNALGLFAELEQVKEQQKTEMPEQQKTEAPDKDAIEKLRKILSIDDKGFIDNSALNYERFINHFWGNSLAFNELSGLMVAKKDIVMASKRPIKVESTAFGKPLEDYMVNAIASDMSGARWKNKSLLRGSSIDDAVDQVCRRRGFHPFRDYLASLPEWDGVPRASSFFIDYSGAKDCNFTHEATRYFIVAAVARAFGTEVVDMMPILYGPEGTGKTSMMERLVPYKELFTSSMLLDQGEKGLIETSDNCVIAEIAELDTVNRIKDGSSLKKIMSLRTARARLSYNKRATDMDISFVMYATVNDPDFLRTDLGERRWLPIKITGKKLTKKKAKKRFKKIEENRAQIWAEALHLYKENNGLIKLSKKALKSQKKATTNVARTGGDEQLSAIEGYLDMIQQCGRSRVCTLEVRVCALGGRAEIGGNYRSRTRDKEVAASLRKLGWEPDGGNIGKSDSDEIKETMKAGDHYRKTIDCYRQRTWSKTKKKAEF